MILPSFIFVPLCPFEMVSVGRGGKEQEGGEQEEEEGWAGERERPGLEVSPAPLPGAHFQWTL